MTAPADRIDALIDSLDDWRGKALADLRKSILASDKQIVEEWKWLGSPTWECDGIIAVATVLKRKLKLTFMHGAKLKDTGGLFNAGMGGGKWRAIDIEEGDRVSAKALKALVREAIAFNHVEAMKRKSARKTR